MKPKTWNELAFEFNDDEGLRVVHINKAGQITQDYMPLSSIDFAGIPKNRVQVSIVQGE